MIKCSQFPLDHRHQHHPSNGFWDFKLIFNGLTRFQIQVQQKVTGEFNEIQKPFSVSTDHRRLLFWQCQALVASLPPQNFGCSLPVVAGFCLLTSNLRWFLIFFFAFLLAVYSNRYEFSNDYFDYIKGATPKRENAPVRMVSSGLIKPRTMLVASLCVLLVLFLEFTL